VSSQKQIVVACALVQKDGKVLVVQRGPGKSRAGKWEFPGGKLNENETLEQCVVREVQEELHLTIEVIAPLDMHQHTYTDIAIELHAFICGLTLVQEIVLTEHIAFEWVEPNDLTAVDLSEADKHFISKYLDSLESTS